MSNEVVVSELSVPAPRRPCIARALCVPDVMVFIALCGFAAACGEEDRPLSYGPGGNGGTRDGGARDGAVSLADGGGFDHVIRSGELELCGYDDHDALELPGSAVEAEVAIAADKHSFALVFHDEAGELVGVKVPVGARAEPAQRIAGTDEAVGAVAVASVAEQVLLLFRGEGDDASALRLRALHAGDEDQSATELSDALGQSPGGGELFALLALDDDFVVAFVERDGEDAALRVQRIDATGAAAGDALTIDGVAEREPEDLHLARLDGSEVLLAWLERDDDGQGHVMGIVLSSQLIAEDEPIELSQYAVDAARFDLSARSRSAGLVYHAKDGDTRDTVKFRRVDGDGQVTGSAFNVVNAPGRAVGGSIAAFGQGYAVAYRVLPSLGVDQAAIVVAFINQFGAIVYEAEIATTSEQGGRTTLATTADGHLLVGWTHVAVSTPVTRGLQLYCPGALELCGGHLE